MLSECPQMARPVRQPEVPLGNASKSVPELTITQKSAATGTLMSLG